MSLQCEYRSWELLSGRWQYRVLARSPGMRSEYGRGRNDRLTCSEVVSNAFTSWFTPLLSYIVMIFNNLLVALRIVCAYLIALTASDASTLLSHYPTIEQEIPFQNTSVRRHLRRTEKSIRSGPTSQRRTPPCIMSLGISSMQVELLFCMVSFTNR
jgi:energy-converting hydrogenase Eha subunit A